MDENTIEEKTINLKLIYGIIAIIISVIIFAVVINLNRPREFCGNGICEYGENINNCCVDCGCPNGYECKNNTCINLSHAKSVCGDGICSDDENCYDCPRDCKCLKGQYCSKENKECVYPQCGNGICEPFESFENCCDDCPCGISWFVCNKTTHKCEEQKINITMNEAEQLVIDYFNETRIEIINTRLFEFNGTIGWQIDVMTSDKIVYIFVSENRDIIELPVM